MTVKQSMSMRYGQQVPADRTTSGWRHPAVAQGAGLLSIAVLTSVHGLWVAQVLLIALLLTVPGVILLRALRVSGRSIADHPVYVPSASLLVLTASGLAVDVAGPLAGISQPLRLTPLLSGFELICIVLAAIAFSAPAETQIPWNALSRPTWLLPVLLPLVGAAGALRLNTGNSNHVALLAVTAVIVVLAATFWLAPRFDQPVLTAIIYASGLALMWSYSLRGDSVYGFDISTEYYTLHQTVLAGVWHFAHPSDAYGAMLSVTVLPAELHSLTGVSDLLIFKFVYPVVGALFPVAVYGLARRVLVTRFAFMAAAFVVMQSTFFQELPALARQEVSTALFAALIVAVLDTRSARRARWTFAALLSLGMVVSHYSTTYLAIPVLAIAMLLQWAISGFRLIPRLTGSLLLAFLVTTVAAALWYGPVTDSTANVTEFVGAAKTQGLSVLPNTSGNLISTYLQGEELQTMSPSQYQAYISKIYATQNTYVTPLPDASQPQYALQPAPSATPPVTFPLGLNLSNLAGLIVQQLANLLAGIGSLVLALRRKEPEIARQVGLLGLGAMAILLLTRLSGTIAQYYNPDRAFLQSTIVLAIAIGFLFQRLGVRWVASRPAILVTCTASLAVFLVGSSNMAGVLFGGGTTTNLADTATDYQNFDVSTQELAAATWVNDEATPNQLIYADRYAQLRLNSVAGTRNGVLGDITPETVDQNAWIYASRTNLQDNITRSVTGNYGITYAFPKGFLDTNFDVVYNNGTSEVFHR